MKRLKLVLSCYACEPNRGSEPGVGWNWALGMAKRHDTYVLTRANNREVIERELVRLKLLESETPKFIYVDLCSFACKLKKKGIMPVSLYYLLWQFKARRTLDSLNLNANIIHHVTFCSFMLPGVWWGRKEKVVLGPIGGMCLCPSAYLRLFKGSKFVKEILRTLVLRLWRLNVFFLLSKKYADAMLFVDGKTQDILVSGAKCSTLMMDTAVPVELEDSQYDSTWVKQNQFVFAGILEPRKGFEIAIRAFAQAFYNKKDKPLLKVFGSGSEFERYKYLVCELELEKFVEFHGKVSQERLWEEVRKSKALLFPSVRDTCGSITLEALAVQTPVVCFNHQGVGVVTDDDCAIRLKLTDWTDSISKFSGAIQMLAQTPDLVSKMGISGRSRVLDNFVWSMKFDLADKMYTDVLES